MCVSVVVVVGGGRLEYATCLYACRLVIHNMNSQIFNSCEDFKKKNHNSVFPLGLVKKNTHAHLA